jgi:geranylgeranyl reductase family protein
VIIGAGPAGSAAAIRLMQLGIHDVVLTDRSTFPRHKTCGSGISPKGIQVLKQLEVLDTILPQSYKVSGLRLVTPGGRELSLSGGEETAALICSRRTLDHALVQHAQSHGARFIPDFAANELLYEGSRVAGFNSLDGRSVRARFTVVANGAHSKFVVNTGPRRMMQTIMGWWDDVPFEPQHVEMVFDKMLTPCYGWLFPESKSRVNIGICYDDPQHSKNGRALFQHFLDKHYRTRLAGAVQIGQWKGYPVSYSYRVGQLQSPGRLIAGEAGRMTHPATAEGIYQGMLSGMMAAETLKKAMSNPEHEQQAWSEYEERCRQAFGTSFWCAKLWRGAVRAKLLDAAVDLCRRPAANRAFNRLMSQM